jgi:DNA-binding GntR family transcriptional regulator
MAANAAPPQTILQPLELRTLGSSAAAAIRDAITSGAYAPGQHLVERHMATELGVSTIAVRDAFALLAEEGLVKRVPRRGTFVSSMPRHTLEDITRVRIALEYLVVELAIENWTPSARAEVQQIVDAMAAALRADDLEALLDLDTRFHEYFWRIAGSETLLELAANLRGRITRFLREANMSLRRNERRVFLEAHRDWLAAVDSGDLNRARAEVRRQVMIAFERISTRVLIPAPDEPPGRA